VKSRSLIWQGINSPFTGFMEWSEWLYARVGRRSSIELKALASLLFEFLTTVRSIRRDEAGGLLVEDYKRGGRSDLPPVLREFDERDTNALERSMVRMKRQGRVVNQSRSD
jgi:hypothetical protein